MVCECPPSAPGLLLGESSVTRKAGIRWARPPGLQAPGARTQTAVTQRTSLGGRGWTRTREGWTRAPRGGPVAGLGGAGAGPGGAGRGAGRWPGRFRGTAPGSGSAPAACVARPAPLCRHPRRTHRLAFAGPLSPLPVTYIGKPLIRENYGK
ncbi:hypothetical protein SAM23877_5437 [Streptomyces ambofaciens ATCC 23877]|uniref:Uncharacterized protein n=1 Tax=Streptomyces ambofaciens (strain ATCC 23877 / 3486 / DSM 40053 / JCM 4204 / NBRC 12836 / NRRL B-2516) TaxID=278992 RepID=A0A0K2B056_STRA7|nr:hypothetical protein SAM23877_5437 [Streptomyces ambofaciens ATCC 23877]